MPIHIKKVMVHPYSGGAVPPVLRTMSSLLIPEIFFQAVALLYGVLFYEQCRLCSYRKYFLRLWRCPVLRTMSSLLIPEVFSQAVALLYGVLFYGQQLNQARAS